MVVLWLWTLFFSELYELLIILGIICLKLYLMYFRSVFVFAAV